MNENESEVIFGVASVIGKAINAALSANLVLSLFL